MESIIQSIVNMFQDSVAKEIIVFIISMIPILELRGSILAAGFLDMEFLSTFIIAVIGNFLPIPFILLFIRQIFKWLKKVPGISKLVIKIEERAMGKSDKIKKYEFWGLVLFVGIPLPGTGAWTGSLIAALLEVDVKKAVLAELLGIAIATIIMSFVSYGLLGVLLG